MASIVLSILFAIEIIKIVGVVTYDIKCPHRSHWQLRALKSKCENEPFYHCLYDKNTKNLTEKCTKPDDIPSGFRAVLSGNLDFEKCSDTYFAPFIYWSNDSAECPYQKSICADEGQVLSDNGSEDEDVKCFCDYRQGYEYIFKPKHDCYCSPTVEDCTCIRKRCKEEGFILTSEYICVTKDQVIPDMKCGMNNKSGSNVNEDHTIKANEGLFPDTNIDKYHLKTFFIVLIVLGIILIGVSALIISCIWYCMNMEKTRGTNEQEFLWESVKSLSKFQDLSKKLEMNSLLVLKGRTGTGKNTIATCLKRTCRSKPCQIKRLTDQELSEIEYLLTNMKETKLIILAKHISDELRRLLQPHNTTDIICDLDDDNFYDTNDKENILAFHRKKNNIPSEEEWKQCQTNQKSTEVYMKKSLEADLCKEKTLKGFPWMCASLCKDHINLGIRYFRQPPEDLVSDLNKLKIKGEHDNPSAIKYCLLVSVLLSNDDELTVDNILDKSFEKAMTDIYPTKKHFTMENVKSILLESMQCYLKIDRDSKIVFYHHSIYHAVLISYGKTDSKNVAKNVMNKCKISDILFLLVPLNYKPMPDEMVLKANYSRGDFRKRVTDSLILNSSDKSIIEQLKFFTETWNETDLLQFILTEIKTNQAYTYQSRLMFFRRFDVLANDFSEVFKPELTVYCLAWNFVLTKLDANEKNSNVLKHMLDKPDVLKDVLGTRIDDHGNTLFHYLVIWNGQEDKRILYDTLSKHTKGVIDEQQVNDFIVSTECSNNERRTPLHFAAYFGRSDLFDTLKQIRKVKRNNETWYQTFKNILFQEHSTLDSLIESGEINASETIKQDEYEHIYFEEELIPSTLNIKHGAHEDFEQIKLLLRTDL